MGPIFGSGANANEDTNYITQHDKTMHEKLKLFLRTKEGMRVPGEISAIGHLIDTQHFPRSASNEANQRISDTFTIVSVTN